MVVSGFAQAWDLVCNHLSPSQPLKQDARERPPKQQTVVLTVLDTAESKSRSQHHAALYRHRPHLQGTNPAAGSLPRGHSTRDWGFSTGTVGPGSPANIRLHRGTVAGFPSALCLCSPGQTFCLPHPSGTGGWWQDCPRPTPWAVVLGLASFRAVPHSRPLPCSVIWLFKALDFDSSVSVLPAHTSPHPLRLRMP